MQVGDKLVPIEDYTPPYPKYGKAPGIICDEIDALWHPATGEILTSKSNFRKATQAAGCVEIGNEKMDDNRQWGIGDARKDISKAIDEAS